MTETYVYDAFGKLAAEYSTVAPTAGGTFYRTPDHLGSTRLVTKQDKSDADCYDYAPFGEEIPNTLGNRSSNACFAASFDGRHRFTGKERDDESDLDYFLARYYSGPMGRFTSVDPLLNSGRPDDPQTWNRYSYVGGNPLSFIDPLGLYRFAVKCAEGDSACEGQQQRFREGLAEVRSAADALKEGTKERKVLEKVLKKIGEEEDMGATIVFGSLEGRTVGKGNPFTNTITLDLTNIDIHTKGTSFADKQNPRAFNKDEVNAFLAGTIAHEGRHLLFKRERGALLAESMFYQGRGLNDPQGYLWNESWRTLDRKTLEDTRGQEIRKYQEDLKRNKK